MTVNVETKQNACYIGIKSHQTNPIRKTEEIKAPNVLILVDRDKDGNVVGMEIVENE